MTAEIAVLNRNAVALAADSAVTLRLPEGSKIYQTNKLFTLSKYEPVGIMVFGSADFMEIPWETIVKSYRAQLNKTCFRRLEDYAGNFLSFLERSTNLFSQERQNTCVYQLSRSWLRKLKVRLHEHVEAEIKSHGKISDKRAGALFQNIVQKDVAHLRVHHKFSRFRRTGFKPLLQRYRKPIRAAITDELQKLAGYVRATDVETGCALNVTSTLYMHNESGVVIAGFGSGDVFPSLRCYTVDAALGGRLRGYEMMGKRSDLNAGPETAAVIAFAQSEMVSLFMNGIDDDYQDFLKAFVNKVLTEWYPSMMSKALQNDLSSTKLGRFIKQLRKVGNSLASTLESGLNEYGRITNSDPIRRDCQPFT